MATPGKTTTKWPSRYSDPGKPSSKGGFGEGKVLTDTWLERSVFAKSIHVAKALPQLTREVEAISAIRSKYVVAIYEVVRGSSGSIEGIIYEYLPGSSLSVAMFRSGTDVSDYLKTLFQLASGVADIHSAKIVHRDIKLQNVKKDAEGILKIFDFGISSDVGDITNASRGTMFYVAPELFKRPAKISPEIDVYAFGATCWALVTSSIPGCLFEKPPQSTSTVPSIKTVRSDLPDPIANIIDKSLSVDPKARPTAEQIRGVLHRHLVKDRHKAFVGVAAPQELSARNREIGLKNTAGFGEIRIRYDGLDFVVTHVKGEVFLNNRPVAVNEVLDHACVITFGNQGRGIARSFVEFNVSHPEVVL
jgi:eukaryotic-like serine/threonine-protein kinase